MSCGVTEVSSRLNPKRHSFLKGLAVANYFGAITFHDRKPDLESPSMLVDPVKSTGRLTWKLHVARVQVWINGTKVLRSIVGRVAVDVINMLALGKVAIIGQHPGDMMNSDGLSFSIGMGHSGVEMAVRVGATCWLSRIPSEPLPVATEGWKV